MDKMLELSPSPATRSPRADTSPRRRKARFATRQIHLPCPPFTPAAPLSRKYYSFARGCGNIPALRESKFALARPLCRGCGALAICYLLFGGCSQSCAPILPTLSCRAARRYGWVKNKYVRASRGISARTPIKTDNEILRCRSG